MEKELMDYVAQRAEALATTGASTQVTKDAAQAWLDAVAADEAAADAATETLVGILDGRPKTIDEVIGFAQGPAADILGQEIADKMLAEQLQRKEAGEKFCNCDACTAATEILAKFGRISL